MAECDSSASAPIKRHRVLLQAGEVLVIQVKGRIPKHPVVLIFRQPEFDRVYELTVGLHCVFVNRHGYADVGDR